MPASDADPGAATPRWAAIDSARGVAVAAMIAYHFAWDLSFFRLIATDVVGHPAWQLFARAIAATFLMLVGAGLVLAHGKGLRRRSFLRRLAVVAAAALMITLATSLAMPESYIFFGILHCIALTSVLALPFLRAPVAVALAAAAFAFAAPA
ncbi:MAG TPA: heparan-alpha-glucosaminide N-acetyltransferase domain-containing protein, partial [Beijerinckiaceae bacterium]|nr:heparan-alpha-glucosaminide N-acetyltransferase domain-containing protein [Beijerinckiaceae bacterium]